MDSTALGHTVSEIDVKNARIYDKTAFSMVIPEVDHFLKSEESRKSVILFGIEVCSYVKLLSASFLRNAELLYSFRLKCVSSKQLWT